VVTKDTKDRSTRFWINVIINMALGDFYYAFSGGARATDQPFGPSHALMHKHTYYI